MTVLEPRYGETITIQGSGACTDFSTGLRPEVRVPLPKQPLPFIIHDTGLATSLYRRARHLIACRNGEVVAAVGKI